MDEHRSIEIDSTDAAGMLGLILIEVREGAHYVITRHGTPIFEIKPASEDVEVDETRTSSEFSRSYGVYVDRIISGTRLRITTQAKEESVIAERITRHTPSTLTFTSSELSNHHGSAVLHAQQGGIVLVTKNGRPICLITPYSPELLELIQKHLAENPPST